MSSHLARANRVLLELGAEFIPKNQAALMREFDIIERETVALVASRVERDIREMAIIVRNSLVIEAMEEVRELK